jgi:hypothetical protein
MKAILRTWHLETPAADKVVIGLDKTTTYKSVTFTDKIVTISDNHNFADGPYVDTVPFAVGSNQEILPLTPQ